MIPVTFTEKRHWRNGHQIRGGHFHTWAFSFGPFGLMITSSKPRTNLYILTGPRARRNIPLQYERYN
jgi:hypothetical protein